LNLVYQAYGNLQIIRQSLFSIASLLQVAPDFDGKIFIYTDRVDELKKFLGQDPRFVLREIQPKLIEDWSGPLRFVHRVKLKVLLDVLMQASGRIVYLDGDTIFRQNPSALFSSISPQNSLMHVSEFELSRPGGILPKKIARFVKGKVFKLPQDGPQASPVNQELKVDLNFSMWNAGVIGFDEANRKFLPRALAFTDIAYGEYQKHVMEQLAVSVCLQERGKVSACDEVIEHYWQHKVFFQQIIDSYLEKNASLAMAVKNFPTKEALEPPPLPIKQTWGIFSFLFR